MNETQPVKRVGIWIRVSTEDQAKGDSPEHHEKRGCYYAESKSWKVDLALPAGERQTVLISRGNLRGFVAPGSRVRAQFWRGKITQIQYEGRQAETYANPDWRLDNNRVGSMMCSLLLLALIVLLLRRVRIRVRFRIA